MKECHHEIFGISNLEEYAIEYDSLGQVNKCKIPADIMEDFVEKLFTLEENEFRNTVISLQDKHFAYNEEDQTYTVDYPAYGGVYPEHPFVGYVNNGDTYTLYYNVGSKKYTSIDKLMADKEYLIELGVAGDFENSIVDSGIFCYVILNKSLKMTVSYDGEYIKMLSGEIIDIEDIPDTSEMITPEGKPQLPDILYEVEDGITVEGDGAFPKNTIVKAESVKSGEIFQRVQASLTDVAQKNKIAVFNLTATSNGSGVQPTQKVTVKFDLPSNLSAENLKMFYISENGEREEIDITIDENEKTVMAQLSHFSTYVLLNIQSEEEIPSSSTSDKNTVNKTESNNNKNDENVNKADDTNSEVPNTSDMSAINTASSLLTLSLIAFLIFSRKLKTK